MDGSQPGRLQRAHDFAVDRVDTGADVELDRESAPLNFFSKLAHSAASDGEGLVEEDDLSNPVLPLEELHLINNMFDAAEPQLLGVHLRAVPTVPGAPSCRHHGGEWLEEREAVVVRDRHQVPRRHRILVDVLRERPTLCALEFARVVSIDDPLNLIPAATALFDVLADLKDGLLAVAHHSDVEAVPGQALLGIDRHVGPAHDDQRIRTRLANHLRDLDHGRPAQRLGRQGDDLRVVVCDSARHILGVQVLHVQVNELHRVAVLAYPRGDPSERKTREYPQLLRRFLGQRLLVRGLVVLDEENLGVLCRHAFRSLNALNLPPIQATDTSTCTGTID